MILEAESIWVQPFFYFNQQVKLPALSHWLSAARPRTLPLALSSIFMGSFLAAYAHQFDWVVLVLSAITTVLLQVLSNLANDLGDSVHGADHTDRTGPARMVQSGHVSQQQMRMAVIVFGILSFVSGLGLVFYSLGIEQLLKIAIFIVLGGAAIWAAIHYTGGSNPYGYAGLGDISVLLFFGLLGVLGTYYLHTNDFSWTAVLPAMACGLFATGVLNLNNIRDISSDVKAGKRSIPVRIGRKAAVWYHLILISTGFLSAVTYTAMQQGGLMQYIYLLTLPLFYISIRAVWLRTEASELDPYLKQLALSTLAFVLLFGIGLLI